MSPWIAPEPIVVPTGAPSTDLWSGEASFHLLFETHDSIMWLVDPADGAILDANPAAASFYGYSRDVLRRMKVTQINALPPNEIDAVVARASELRLNNWIFPHRTADGTVRTVEVHSSPVQIGRRRLLFSIIHDITDRITAQEELNRSEERFQAMVEKSADGVVLISPDHRILYASPAVERVIGLTAGELLAVPDPFDLIHPDDLPGFLAESRHIGPPGTPQYFSLRVRHRDGSWRNVDLTRTNHLDESAVAALVINVRDVTDRVRLEGQLRHAQKMDAIGKLAGGIAHDFNNLLTAILGHLSLLGRAPLTPAQRDSLSAALQAAQRAAELTGHMLGFSRRSALRLEPTDLNATVGEAVTILRGSLDPRINLTLCRQPGLWPALADSGQITQVLLNLALNARDAMPAGGSLTLETANCDIDAIPRGHADARPGPHVRLSVRDTGIGIAPELLGRIFEPFFTTKPAGQGTGLGLAMVYGIVQQHHGWIDCVSTVDLGTNFHIYLPRCHGAAPARQSTPDRSNVGRETVLLVDDDPSIRSLARMILEDDGYRVLVADDGLSAIDLYRRVGGEIDLVLMDLSMPRMSGADAVHHLRRIDGTVKVLVSSGHPGEAALVDGAVGTVDKPYEPDDLSEAVRQALAHGRASPSHND